MVESAARRLPLTACPICGGGELDPLGERSDGVAVVECRRCGMGFVAERPRDPLRLYGDDYFAGEAGAERGYTDYHYVATHSLSWAAELVRLLQPAGRVLDVGCADGFLLGRLGPGYERSGIEPNEQLARRCAAAGIRILGRDAGDPELARRHRGSFDVITAIAVLEHLVGMRQAVENLHAMLDEDGWVLFETPLVGGRSDDAIWYRSSLEHIFYPTRRGLEHLFAAVFGHPPAGRQVRIAGYGSVFVGLAARRPQRQEELAARCARLLDAPFAELSGRERVFRLYFGLVHAARPEAASVAALAELAPAADAPLLARLGQLWSAGLVRESDLQDEAVRQAERSRAAQAEAAAARSELAASRRHVEQLVDSTSWRVTAPLRGISRGLRALARRLGPRTTAWRLLRALYRALPLSPGTRARVADRLRSRGLAPAAAGPAPAERPVVEAALAAWPVSQPLVSVVIPCFNYGHVVHEAVESVVRQTFQDFEILVVEGGSTDPASVAAVRALAAPKTRTLFRDRPCLPGDNRNFGIARARGKYICCLDADDLLRPTYLEKALFLLETQGYDVVSTAIGCFGGDDRVYGVERFPALADLLRGNQVATCAVFSRRLWEEAGGFVDAGAGPEYVFEDWRLWVRFAALGARIANLVDEPLFRYRVHGAGLSRGVTAIDRQREAVAALNADVIDPEAHRRSEDRRAVRVRVDRPLLNLARAGEQANPGRTVLLAVPFLIVGGAERLLAQIVARLRRRGYRLVIVSTVHADATFGDCTDWFEASTDEVYHLPRFLPPELWRDFVFFLFETKRVDLLWIVGSVFFYDLLPELKSAFPRLKTIDLLFNAEVHAPRNRERRQYIDCNLVENVEVLEYLRRRGETPDRLRLIESGVDLEAFRPGPRPAEVLRELGIPADAFVAGFSGRLAEEKRPEAFLEIASRLRDDPRFWFVMTGAGPLADELHRRIAALGLGPRLQFLGRVEDPRRYLAIYDALVLPSRIDGRPVVVMEALAMGVPVVASRVGALPELIADGETGVLCDPRAIGDFAAALAKLAADPEERRRMGAAGRRFAEAELSAERMLGEYERVLAELLGETGEGSALAEHRRGDARGGRGDRQTEGRE